MHGGQRERESKTLDSFAVHDGDKTNVNLDPRIRLVRNKISHVSRNQTSHALDVKQHRKKSLTCFFWFSCSVSALKPQTLCHQTTFWNQRLSWVNWGTDPCQTWNVNLIPDLIVSPSSTWFSQWQFTAHADTIFCGGFALSFCRLVSCLTSNTHRETVASVTQHCMHKKKKMTSEEMMLVVFETWIHRSTQVKHIQYPKSRRKKLALCNSCDEEIIDFKCANYCWGRTVTLMFGGSNSRCDCALLQLFNLTQ